MGRSKSFAANEELNLPHFPKLPLKNGVENQHGRPKINCEPSALADGGVPGCDCRLPRHFGVADAEDGAAQREAGDARA